MNQKLLKMIESSSFIRKMFETGAKMKAEFGEENVFDFSLGNPYLFPPKKFTETLIDEAKNENQHKYMQNAGYHFVKSEVAKFVSKEQNIKIPAENVIMTCGAGGALNVALKTILNPGEKILVSKPYFVEYGFYCDNHQGILEPVNCQENFELDIDEFSRKIDSKTAAIIINSPNNPSGKIYSKETLQKLAELLEQKSKEYNKRIYIITDEPYRKITFDQVEVPSVLEIYPHTLLCTSYSKDLSIPGERIGYLIIHPHADQMDQLLNGSVLCNRILGYVNAPALMQRTIARLQGISVDPALYQRKRDLLVSALQSYGFTITPPQGTFYLFPQAANQDDLKTIQILQKHKILAVPGRGFGLPGYFRLAFCISDEMIEKSLPAFEKAAKELFN